jgi:hypothetical protein
MIGEFGALKAAKRLLATQDVQSGLGKLWELNALDKSMEALVIRYIFQPLFTDDEIAEARRRLQALDYFK